MVKLNKKQKKLVSVFSNYFIQNMFLEVSDVITHNKAREGLTLLAKDMRNVKVTCDKSNNTPEIIDKSQFCIDLYFSKYMSDFKLNIFVVPFNYLKATPITMTVKLSKLEKFRSIGE